MEPRGHTHVTLTVCVSGMIVIGYAGSQFELERSSSVTGSVNRRDSEFLDKPPSSTVQSWYVLKYTTFQNIFETCVIGT